MDRLLPLRDLLLSGVHLPGGLLGGLGNILHGVGHLVHGRCHLVHLQ